MSLEPSLPPASEGVAFERLRDLFDHLPAAVALVRGPNHVYEFVNPVYRRMMGPRDFVGRTVDEVVPELREQGFVAALDLVYRTGERVTGRESRIELQHEDGVEEVFVDFVYQPMRGAGGEVEAILGFGVDVTEAVRAREDRFRQAIDNMIDTVLIAAPVRDEEGRIVDLLVTFVNEGRDELGRRGRSQLVGRRFSELWPNATPGEALARCAEVLDTGNPLVLEDFAYTDEIDGEAVGAVFDIRASRLGEDLFIVFRDVTDRLARERALVESRARLAHEHEMVLALQSALLPRELPAYPGVDLAAEYVAATAGIEVGGDWFDVFTLPDGCLAVCVGDVAGKGIGAAQVMAQLRSAGRVAAMAGQGPAAVMSSKNALMATGDLGPLATTMFARYEPGGQVTWVSAGHLPPLLARADGSPPELLATPEEPPIGVLPHVDYTCRSFVLEPGDRLVLYTDGLIERRHEGLEEGLARLRAAVPAGADAASTCQRLLEELGVAADRPDDVCIVTLRRTA